MVESTHDSEDWQKLDELLDAALDLSPEDLPQWLDQTCGSDRALRARLEKLLELSEGEDDLLRPKGAMSGPVWEDVLDDLE